MMKSLYERAQANLFFNNTVENCSWNGEPIPDGEFGPQCDAIPEDVIPLAMDDRYVYGNDGERYEWRRARGES